MLSSIVYTRYWLGLVAIGLIISYTLHIVTVRELVLLQLETQLSNDDCMHFILLLATLVKLVECYIVQILKQWMYNITYFRK